jgi:hypothetical protein
MVEADKREIPEDCFRSSAQDSTVENFTDCFRDAFVGLGGDVRQSSSSSQSPTGKFHMIPEPLGFILPSGRCPLLFSPFPKGRRWHGHWGHV